MISHTTQKFQQKDADEINKKSEHTIVIEKIVEKLLLETTNVETYLKPAKTTGHTSKAACHAC